jgi:hypothetical protein
MACYLVSFPSIPSKPILQRSKVWITITVFSPSRYTRESASLCSQWYISDLYNSSVKFFAFSTGLDNLHNPDSVILHAQEHASTIFHSRNTHFLVNGTTAGILAAVTSCCPPERSTLLVSRVSHSSVFNAASLARTILIIFHLHSLVVLCAVFYFDRNEFKCVVARM